MNTTPRREQVLNLIRQERTRQISLYGTNEHLEMGFSSTVLSHPWLYPFSSYSNVGVEEEFRTDYEQFEKDHGNVTWMHLIREEVAELFATRTKYDAIAEAVQVAALCVSVCEKLIAELDGEQQ